MSSDIVRYRVVVHGRVQGVFYRDECRHMAETAGVRGWITNAADGTVVAALEGEPAAVDRLLAWMRKGPRRARVTRVDAGPESPRGERGFAVR